MRVAPRPFGLEDYEQAASQVGDVSPLHAVGFRAAVAVGGREWRVEDEAAQVIKQGDGAVKNYLREIEKLQKKINNEQVKISTSQSRSTQVKAHLEVLAEAAKS